MADGFEVNCFASEQDFPELANPVQFTFDAKGRLWVATMQSYPQWKPKDEMNDMILILEDSDGDGKADKRNRIRGRTPCTDRHRIGTRRRFRLCATRLDVSKGYGR